MYKPQAGLSYDRRTSRNKPAYRTPNKPLMRPLLRQAYDKAPFSSADKPPLTIRPPWSSPRPNRAADSLQRQRAEEARGRAGAFYGHQTPCGRADLRAASSLWPRCRAGSGNPAAAEGPCVKERT